MFDRFHEWDEDLLRDEMLEDSAAAKTLPKPFFDKLTFNTRDPNSIPSRNAAQMVRGCQYEFGDVVALVPDGRKTAVSAALRDLTERGVVDATRCGAGHRRRLYCLAEGVQQ